MMRDAEPGTIYLKDYQPSDYLIETTDLHFELGADSTTVSSRLELRRRPGVPATAPLVLDGKELELLSVSLNGEQLGEDRYRVSADSLVIEDLPEICVISCETRIYPRANTALEGLYQSHSMYCTQCEAHGFRKITYYLDRPDVMAVFTVTIDAPLEGFPVLLSNGNMRGSETLPDGRHRAVWHDPFPKPAYLFALVAGDLEHIEDHFVTSAGRDVCLRIYVEEKDLGKCAHAMDSLKRSMRWDEEVYGREYDLNVFNIVAVDDFNMGAMENKSLNIFNTSCVLCSPEITTDSGFQRVEAIVAHEYFHNWSGNRVTCRDWFQLSLKEGFTVFRDAEFSADMGSPTVKRVEDVSLLRTAQFAEDAGPMAHPVRPESFIEINNFYTVTVYEKGAEVVRMIHTLLGAEAFRRGSDLYFDRHDGQAVTCEDFVLAMEDASGVDLGQFRRWYSQAGTPTLRVRGHYDEDRQTYRLEVEQSCPATPGQPVKEPFVIPLAIGLLGDAGNLPVQLRGEQADADSADNTHRVLVIDQPSQSFEFDNVRERPVPSLLRGFSAPVRLDFPYARGDLQALMSRDEDGFVRWDAAQNLATRVVEEVQVQLGSDAETQVDTVLMEAWGSLLADESLDAAMVADMLQLPSEGYLAELAGQEGGADVHAIHQARSLVQESLATANREALLGRYESLTASGPYQPDSRQIAARALRNRCLEYLACADEACLALAQDQLQQADNMTDRLAALKVIAFYGSAAQGDQALDDFYNTWRHEALVVNQWFQVQAANPQGDGLARVQALLSHADFELTNPNKVRSLVGVFAGQNPVNFHRRDGMGYRFLSDAIAELDSLNPQIASRLLTPLTRWRLYAQGGELMRGELQRLAEKPDLSSDVYEIVSKSLRA